MDTKIQANKRGKAAASFPRENRRNPYPRDSIRWQEFRNGLAKELRRRRRMRPKNTQ